MKVYSANDEDFNYTEISDLLNDFPDFEVGIQSLKQRQGNLHY